MVKKKSPVVPITFIVIGVAVIVAVNSRLHPVDPKDAAAEAQKEQQRQMQDSGQLRPPTDPNAMHAALADAVKGGGSQKPSLMMKKGMPGSDPMVASRQQAVKPKPNATTPSSQWYNENSH